VFVRARGDRGRGLVILQTIREGGGKQRIHKDPLCKGPSKAEKRSLGQIIPNRLHDADCKLKKGPQTRLGLEGPSIRWAPFQGKGKTSAQSQSVKERKHSVRPTNVKGSLKKKVPQKKTPARRKQQTGVFPEKRSEANLRGKVREQRKKVHTGPFPTRGRKGARYKN